MKTTRPRFSGTDGNNEDDNGTHEFCPMTCCGKDESEPTGWAKDYRALDMSENHDFSSQSFPILK